MASKGAHTAKSKAPDTTYEEVKYLRRLIDQKIRVHVLFATRLTHTETVKS